MPFFHKKKKKKIQLKWSMTGTLLIGWLMPLLVLTLILLYFVSVKLNEQIERTVTVSGDKAIELCELQMREAISSSRNASYMNNIRQCYYAYQRTGNPKALGGVTVYLNQQYKSSNISVCTMVSFMKDPEAIYYVSNDNNGETNGILNVLWFKNNAMTSIMEEADYRNMDIGLFSKDGRLYLYRYLMLTKYVPYGMITMELNTSALFENLNSVWGGTNYAVYKDGNLVLDTGITVPYDAAIFQSEPSEIVYVNGRDGAYIYKTVQEGNSTLGFIIELDSKVLIDDLYGVRYAILLVVVFLIPLIIMIFVFFHNKITKPVAGLVKAAREIREGNYGMQIEKVGNSVEFAYLEDAFNAMSQELKLQFEKIFLEELALKDANIMALQSQINPHFLNNTLEIINWEARIQGNTKVSSMIEALSTMMNATMNRDNQRLISLGEELEYAEAYFYIISQRMGNRFQYEVFVEDELLKVMVPRLIIQPIVENAVEHGMYPANQGRVTLRMWREADRLFIEIRNNRSLSGEDKEKIEKYLEEDDRQEVNWSGRLGIRNVNRRLKIIYGEDYGLRIENGEENETVSTITVKIEEGEMEDGAGED